MKPTSSLRHFLLIAGSSLMAISSASAQLYWDTDGATAGFGTASGTWGTDAYWNTDSAGGAGTFSTATTTASALNFGTASVGLGSGTINLGSGVQALSLTIGDASGAINFTGGSISGANTTTFTANGSSTANFSNGSFSFASAGARAVTLSGTSANENIFGYDLANSGTGNQYTDVNKSGSGTWVLTGTNTNRDAAVPGTAMPTSRTYSITEGLLIFRGAQSVENTGIIETAAGASLTAIARIESDSNVTMNYSGIRVQTNTGTHTLQLDRQTSGNGDGLTFTFGNTDVQGSYFNSMNSVLNITTGPKITSGTTPTVDFAGTGIRSNVSSSGQQTLNANGVNVRLNGIDTATNANTRTLTMNLGGTSTGNEVYGDIVETSIGTTISIDKEDAGTWTLSGTNTYKGTTTVNAGLLNTTKAAALPGYTTAAKVVINGGTLGVRVGGAGWTTGQVDNLLTNATRTSGALGIDTTNGDLTQWTAFTTTNLGAALGLTKLGTNTLTLDQANTYNGATTVSAGTLLVNNTTGSGTGAGAVSVARGATLGGTGIITGAVTVTGSIAPGVSGIERLDVGATTWKGAATAGSATDWKFNLGASNTEDFLNIIGDFTKDATDGSNFRFDFLNSAVAGTFDLITWSGSNVGFSAGNFSFTNLGTGYSGSFNITGSTLQFVSLIPEPSSALAGLLLTAGLLRRRRK